MFQKIAVPLDGSETAELALEPARELAARFGGSLLLLQVIAGAVHPPAPYSMADAEPWLARQALAQRDAEEYLEGLARQPEMQAVGTRWRLSVGGDPATRVLEVVEEEGLDSIVLATRGRTGLVRFLLGSVARSIVERAPVPIVLVR